VRKLVGIIAAAFCLLTPAALAAGTFEKSNAPANADVDVALNASVENLGIYNARVVLDVPSGFRVLACPETTDFRCTQSVAGRPSHPVLTWTRTTPGAPVPVADRLPFRMHTVDRAGQYVFSVHQYFSDDTSEASAPKLTVTAPPGRATTTTTVKSAPVVHTASARPAPAPTRRVARVSPVSEPDAPWIQDTDSADASPIEIGTERRVVQSPGMIVAGTIAAVLAGGVFWLRRRASAQSSL
jgi:hypothetical protein